MILMLPLLLKKGLVLLLNALYLLMPHIIHYHLPMEAFVPSFSFVSIPQVWQETLRNPKQKKANGLREECIDKERVMGNFQSSIGEKNNRLQVSVYWETKI